MDKDKKTESTGETSFGIQIIIFLVIIFVLWVLMGGPSKSTTKEGAFIVPLSDPNHPGSTYGPK